jgi:SMI1 / KNR4 family (SUKH-1)
MNTAINDLRLTLINEKIRSQLLATENDIKRFRDVHNIQLPDDLVEYFETVNGTDAKYDQNIFQFYSLNNFKSIENMYLDWEGIPDHKAVTKVLPDYQNCFVIADYSIHVISYSIKLLPIQSAENKVYAICGANYKRVAKSFTEFVELYVNSISSLII